jgi:hypothetical protein
MKLTVILLAVALAATSNAAADETVASADVVNQELTGLDVAKLTDKARRAETEHQVMRMTLENSRGQQRVRTIEGWSREVDDEEEKRFVRFLEPADVKDTMLLTYDYDDKDDDIWLYLPALKKVKRILSSNKTDYFMGSDFTYWDMENLDLVNWDYTLKGAEHIDGVDAWLVEATPNNDKELEESGYTRTVMWTGKEDFIPRKIEYYDKKGRLAKRLISSDIRPTSPEDPRPRSHRLVMDNLITSHKTELSMSKLELDVDVDDEVFSQRNLMP